MAVVDPQWARLKPDSISGQTQEEHHAGKRLRRPARSIRETGALPGRQDAIFIGTSANMVAQKSGKLYFVVNDVLTDDKDFPDLFLFDNIGFYYAKVTVSK